MKLELHATPEEVMRAVEALQEFGHQNELGEKEIFGLALALEECGSNIVNHAYRRDPSQKFTVAIEHTASEVMVELRDSGPQFDPTQRHIAESGLKDDDGPGGLGIQLVRQYMDDVHYRRQGRENVLRLTKRLNRDGRADNSPKKNESEKLKQKKALTNMPLEIHILKDVSPASGGSSVTVKLTGSLDTATAPELERQLAPVLATSVKDVVFDLANLKFVSSAGLRVFSTTRKLLKERGGQASFVNMQPQIEEVFAIMKSLPGVAIFQNVAELDRYLAARQRSHEDTGS
jgi:anti-anti-sigma factor